MKVAIIKYNAGNIMSVTYALNRLGIDPVVTDDESILKTADRVIFPGVGEASTAMKYIRDRALDVVIKNLTQPFLGICLGMQLMGKHSEEGDTQCLGIFDASIKKFPPHEKVPHMGWNQIDSFSSPLLAHVPEGSYMYFVHSYYVDLCAATSTRCSYINSFSAGLHQDNFFAFQFHPEKSGELGARILHNFITIK
jgi:glutamine amidotransferase